MVLNNLEIGIKVKCLKGGVTQAELGKRIGTTGQYINRIVKKKDGLLNQTFVKMMEELGYNIQLTYIPGDTSGEK